MTYTFHNILSGTEAQLTQRQAEWMVTNVYGVHYGLKQLGKLDDGKVDYLSVDGGRIKMSSVPVPPTSEELNQAAVEIANDVAIYASRGFTSQEIAALWTKGHKWAGMQP